MIFNPYVYSGGCSLMHICETSTYRFKSKNSTAAYICTSSFMIGSTEFIIVHMDYDKNHMYLLKNTVISRKIQNLTRNHLMIIILLF